MPTTPWRFAHCSWWSRRHRGACLDVPRVSKFAHWIDELASFVVGCGMVSLMQQAMVKVTKENDEPHGGVASLRKYMKSNPSLRCGNRVPVFGIPFATSMDRGS